MLRHSWIEDVDLMQNYFVDPPRSGPWAVSVRSPPQMLSIGQHYLRYVRRVASRRLRPQGFE
jgi:hypothetical protein